MPSASMWPSSDSLHRLRSTSPADAMRVALYGAAVAAGGGLWAFDGLRTWGSRVLLRRRP